MYKSSGKCEKIIDRVISKFKMAKRGSQRTTEINQTEISEKNSSIDIKEDDSDNGKICDAPEMESENRRVSLQDLPVFCQQLEKFIKYIRNVRDLQFLINDYPVMIKNRFDNDVSELECTLMEINSAMTNIKRQKLQHNFVKKEKVSTKKILNKIRDEEFREMEKIVALYDKTLYTRWESVKMTHKPEVLRTLLTDIKCKQLALENLDTLVSRKLGHLKTYSSLITDKSDKEKTAAIPLPFSPLCPSSNDNSNQRKSKIPLPPPLPPPPNSSARNYTRNLSVQRQRRIEIEEDLDNEYRLLNYMDDFLEIPRLNLDNTPDNVIVNLDGNFRPEVFASPQYTNDNVATLRDELLAASLQEEMSTLLQALSSASRVGKENCEIGKSMKKDDKNLLEFNALGLE